MRVGADVCVCVWRSHAGLPARRCGAPPQLLLQTSGSCLNDIAPLTARWCVRGAGGGLHPKRQAGASREGRRPLHGRCEYSSGRHGRSGHAPPSFPWPPHAPLPNHSCALCLSSVCGRAPVVAAGGWGWRPLASPARAAKSRGAGRGGAPALWAASCSGVCISRFRYVHEIGDRHHRRRLCFGEGFHFLETRPTTTSSTAYPSPSRPPPHVSAETPCLLRTRGHYIKR